MRTFWTYFVQLTLSLVARAKKKEYREKKRKIAQKRGARKDGKKHLLSTVVPRTCFMNWTQTSLEKPVPYNFFLYSWQLYVRNKRMCLHLTLQFLLLWLAKKFENQDKDAKNLKHKSKIRKRIEARNFTLILLFATPYFLSNGVGIWACLR